MDLKSPLDDTKNAEMCRQILVSEIINISMYSGTLFVNISNLFLRNLY